MVGGSEKMSRRNFLKAAVGTTAKVAAGVGLGLVAEGEVSPVSAEEPTPDMIFLQDPEGGVTPVAPFARGRDGTLYGFRHTTPPRDSAGVYRGDVGPSRTFLGAYTQNAEGKWEEQYSYEVIVSPQQ